MQGAFVYSIQGSGTRFVMRALELIMKFAPVSVEKFLIAPEEVICTRHHVQGSQDKYLERAQELQMPIVVPLRHPVMNMLTGTSLPKRALTYEARVNLYVDRWHNLKANITGKDVMFFPVDGPQEGRQDLLTALVAYTGAKVVDENMFKSISILWPKVGTRGQSKEQDEFIVTGDVAVYDLTPLNDAIEWYEEEIASLP